MAAPNQFITAIQDLDIERVNALVEKNPKWLAWSEPSGRNALHYLGKVRAAGAVDREAKAVEIAKYLLAKGMDINSVQRIEEKNCDHFPATPLWYAYTHGRNERLYKYLLKRGADPGHCMWAIAWYNDIAAAKLFIRHGAEIERDPGLDELFIGSFAWKKYAFAYWLLSLGADVNAVDLGGNTALIMAVKRKDEESISKLMKCGADPDKKNKKGDSARSIVSVKGPKRLLNLL